MEATAVSLARSVLDGVVSSAGSAVADEVAQLLGVPREVEFIRSELEMMKSFLKMTSAQPETAVHNETVRTWVKQVRDLAYDVEDCLLDFEHYAAMSRGGWSWSSLLGPLLATRHRIAAQIQDLKARVEELNQRNLRYHVAVNHYRQLPPSGNSTTDDYSAELGFHRVLGQGENWAIWTGVLDQAQNVLNIVKKIFPGPRPWPWVPTVWLRPSAVLPDQELAFWKSDIIGRKHDKHELTNLLSRGHTNNTALNVVSVWGMGGMGKSSLVKMVHNNPKLLDEFDCSAWVTVPHPLDNADEFKRRLVKHLSMPPIQQDIKTYLRERRYMIIVDDLLSQEEWDLIWKVLYEFNNNKSSRVVVTTRRKDVAQHCTHSVGDEHGHAYELKPLGKDESMDLLCQTVYRTKQYTLPEEMAEQAGHILKRCWGLPLAISTIGGLLANRPKTSTEWMKLHEYLGAELESDDLRDINRVIVSSYDGLPYHLKSIFLYLSIFPENQEIKYSRLLRRWMAEGYIEKNCNVPVEVVGEHLYNELINRSMMQPLEKISTGTRADRCRVHGMMLQIILSRSIEENQLFLIKKHCHEAPQGKTRHLVVSSWKNRKEKLENINLSYVRSLTVFGECPNSLISPKMRLLRVLDLEDTINVKNKDIRHIGELHHLRYLCLRGTKISKLPSSLRNLQYLETLNIQDTKVTRLPDGITKLQKLRCLIAGVNFSKDLLQKIALAQSEPGNNNASSLFCHHSDKVPIMEQFSVRAPEGIEKLRNLHMLNVINVGQGDGVVEKIKEMTNLQRLGVAGLAEKKGKELCKSIESLSRLHRLELWSRSLEFFTTMDTSAAPKHLVSLRLYGRLSRFPTWISSLNELAKVKLLGTRLDQEQVKLLGELRNLTLLGLWENSYTGESLEFNAGTFQKLKFLDIDRLQNIKNIKIESGALLELERLWLNHCRALHDNVDGLSGVPHLPNLNELVLKNCGEKEELVMILQDQVSTHPKRPKFLVGKIMPTALAA